MPTHVEKLTFKYDDQLLDPLWVILDSDLSPPILPLLFSTYLSTHGVVFEARELVDEMHQNRISELFKREVSDSTIRSYIYCLSQFLDYLDVCKEKYQTPELHHSSSANERFLNHYINQVLASNLGSVQSLNNHRSALQAYYNWLSYMAICRPPKLKIYRKTRQTMAWESKKQHYIQYVSRFWRTSLLNSCNTLAEKLMMRMGYEVGLRTSELVGLRVDGNQSIQKLTEYLDDNEYTYVSQFRYLLNGRYTKGGKSRWIYFDRFLLEDIKHYIKTERRRLIQKTGSRDLCLFLRTDQKFMGTGIGKEHASRVFRKRANNAGINPNLSFHDLRHTFATELFHAELESSDGRETRSESAALIVVAQRLGHTFGKDGHAPSTTTRYIRMRIQMLEMERVPHE